MRYFCAQCRKWHDASEIAFNLWEMLHEDTVKSASEILEASSANISALIGPMFRFCNNPRRSSDLFLLKGCDAEKKMQDGRWQGNVFSGTVCLTLKDILLHPDLISEEDDGERLKEIISEVPASLLASRVSEKELKLYYDRIPNGNGNDSMVLNRFSSIDDDFFEDEETGLLTGFSRVCPYCGYRLSRAVGCAAEIVVLLVGSPRAGKTSSITAIASSLLSNRYAKYNLSMEPFDNDEQYEILKQEISYYEQGKKVIKTPDTVDGMVPSYSFLVTFGNSKRVLTFVDMPGEFWQAGKGLDDEFYKRYGETLKNVHCIWFFISKLMVYGVNLDSIDGFDEDNARKQELIKASAENTKIVHDANFRNVTACFNSLRSHLQDYGVALPPVATILTKTEIILDENDERTSQRFGVFRGVDTNGKSVNYGDHSSIICGNGNKSSINEYQFFVKSRLVREYLRQINAGYCDAVERNFPLHTYIAATGYGHPAAEREARVDAEEPIPFHELFPLLWTLSVAGGTRVTHQCIWGRYRLGRQVSEEKGTITIPFSYRRYLAQQETSADEKLIMANIAHNLLMEESDSKSDVKYKKTEFRHPWGD